MRRALLRAFASSSVLVALAGGCDPNPDAPSAPSATTPAGPRPGASKVERATRTVGPPLGSPSP